MIEGLPWARKLVDDIIIWASNLAELSLRINKIISRSEKLNIILSKKKFVVSEEILVAGYMISKSGVKAIKEFPVPTHATGVKYFLDLTNQLSFFIPDDIQNSKALRELCGKKIIFNGLPEHQFEFETIKIILSANLLNRLFFIWGKQQSKVW